MKSSLTIFILVLAALFIMLYVSNYFVNDNSHILYSTLETKKAETTVARLVNPESACFSLDNKTIGRYAFLRDIIKNADDDAMLPPPPMRYFSNNRYDGFENSVNATDAIPLIRQFQPKFNHTVVTETIRNYTDDVHTFECNFAYGGNQYYLSIKFQSLTALNDHGGFVPIDMPSKNNGRSARYTTYYPFNNTAVWTNNKDSIASLKLQTIIDNRTILISTNILPGGSWDYRLQPNYASPGDTIYHYEVEDDNNGIEKGDIIVKYYPPCMDQHTATSLYQQTGVRLEFPIYLPEGYHYICGIEFYDTVLLATYWNHTVSDPFEQKYGDANQYDFIYNASQHDAPKNGILVVYAGKSGELIPFSNGQDRFADIQNETYYIDQQLVTIHNRFTGANNQAVLYIHNLYDEKDISILELFDEPNHITYIFEGKVPFSELTRMAESLRG